MIDPIAACPICGSPAILQVVVFDTCDARVYCANDGCPASDVPESSATNEGAIATWNSRADLASKREAELVAALRDAMDVWNARDRIHQIDRVGYPRAEERDALERLCDEWQQRRRELLAGVALSVPALSGVRVEREACAKVAESNWGARGSAIAAAIRSRSTGEA